MEFKITTELKMEDPDQVLVDLACPECGHQDQKTLRWLYDNAELVCPCGFTLPCKPHYESAVAQLKEVIEKFQKDLFG